MSLRSKPLLQSGLSGGLAAFVQLRVGAKSAAPLNPKAKVPLPLFFDASGKPTIISQA
jgi:hypothetical protein